MSFTVYFDTNFYVWLAKAAPDVANSVLDRLNAIEIRHVLSSHILHELLSGSGRDLQDRQLVERVNRFALAPYRIQYGQFHGIDSIQWELLLLAGNDRVNFAKFLQSVFDTETVARSLSTLAEKKLNQNDQKRVEKAVKPFLYALGMTSESSNAERIEKFAEFSGDLIAKMSEFLPREIVVKLKTMDLSPEAIARDPTSIANNLLSALGESNVKKLKQEKDLSDSAVALDPRPVRTVVGDSSKKEFLRLGNTFRDAVHMGIFLANHHSIDLLQVDLRQQELIQRNNPIHSLREAGFADRCFAVGDISEAVSFLEKYVGKQENQCAE